MFTEAQFVELLQDRLALTVTHEDMSADVALLPDWNSANLIRLAVALEDATGRRVPVDKLLVARTLDTMYRLAVG